MNDEIKKKIEEIFGELIDLEQHSFTTGSVTQLYVKWDDLLTAQFDVEKKLSALYTEMVEGELSKSTESSERDTFYNDFHNLALLNGIGRGFVKPEHTIPIVWKWIERNILERTKYWYFDGDELVIKKGKWVIDRYKKHEQYLLERKK